MEKIVGDYYIENGVLEQSSNFPKTDIDSVIIYEVIRVINNTALFFEEHYNRLINSIYLAKFEYKTIPDKEVIINYINTLITNNNLSEGNVKLGLMYSDNKFISLKIYFIPHAYPTIEDYENGVNLISINAIRKQPNIKIRNRSLRKQSNDIIKENNIFEVLLINKENNITEGSRSNIFFIKDDVVYTAKGKDILKGITWQYVVRICNSLGIKVHEQDINLSEINNFDSCFLTGTSPKVMPINKIDDIDFQVRNYLTNNILEEYNKIINKYTEDKNGY